MTHTASTETEQITTSHAARLLEVSEGLVRHLADRGQLPCRRIGVIRVFSRSDVERLKAARAGQ